MSDAETLIKAYFVLGMESGSSADAVRTRWKRLSMVWHPDRFQTQNSKDEAEEELKKINAAHDTLVKHFETDHKATGSCVCRTKAPDHMRDTISNPGPGKQRTTQENDFEEAEAARRNAERAKKAKEAAEEPERERARREQEAANRQATAKSYEQQAVTWDDEKLRWKISICIGIAWMALNILGFCGMWARHTWHDISFQIEQIFHKNDPLPIPQQPVPTVQQPVPEQPPKEVVDGNRTLPTFGGPAAPPIVDLGKLNNSQSSTSNFSDTKASPQDNSKPANFGDSTTSPVPAFDKSMSFQNPETPTRPPNPNPWPAPHVTPAPSVYSNSLDRNTLFKPTERPFDQIFRESKDKPAQSVSQPLTP